MSESNGLGLALSLEGCTASQRAMIVTRGEQLMSSRELSALARVTGSYIIGARALRRDGVPALVVAVETGTIAMTTALKIVRMTRVDQVLTIDRVLAAARAGKPATLESIREQHEKPPRTLRLGRHSISERMTRTLDQLDNAVDALDRHLGEARDDVEGATLATWLAEIVKHRDALTRLIHQHKEKAL